LQRDLRSANTPDRFEAEARAKQSGSCCRSVLALIYQSRFNNGVPLIASFIEHDILKRLGLRRQLAYRPVSRGASILVDRLRETKSGRLKQPPKIAIFSATLNLVHIQPVRLLSFR
jgi:hypothetical protein